jgi:hypothetical protein
MRHMTGQPDAAGNLAILDDCRRKIKDDVAAWLKIPSFEREVSEAVSRGAQLPQWSPAPHVQAKDNKDLELKGIVSRSWSAIGVRQGDQDWLNWLNNFMDWHGGQGEFADMFEKWTGVPMPPALPRW